MPAPRRPHVGRNKPNVRFNHRRETPPRLTKEDASLILQNRHEQATFTGKSGLLRLHSLLTKSLYKRSHAAYQFVFMALYAPILGPNTPGFLFTIGSGFYYLHQLLFMASWLFITLYFMKFCLVDFIYISPRLLRAVLWVVMGEFVYTPLGGITKGERWTLLAWWGIYVSGVLWGAFDGIVKAWQTPNFEALSDLVEAGVLVFWILCFVKGWNWNGGLLRACIQGGLSKLIKDSGTKEDKIHYGKLLGRTTI